VNVPQTASGRPTPPETIAPENAVRDLTPRVATGRPLAIGVACLLIVGLIGRPAPASRRATRAQDRACSSAVTLLADSPEETVLRFDTDAPSPTPTGEAATAAAYAGPAGVPGRATTWRATAEAPARFSVLVRIPDEGAIATEILELDLRGPGTGPPPPGTDPLTAEAARLIDVSDPAIVRGVRVVRVSVSPCVELEGQSLVAASVTVRIASAPGPGVNEQVRRRPPPSAAFRRIRDRAVINAAAEDGRRAESPAGAGARDGARYLVIAPDQFVEALAPLVEWKRAKGITCRIAPTSETGLSTQEIREYILDAYFGWDPPPEYVLLAGDRERIPVHNGLAITDNFYAAIDGADYLADVLVGRLPAETAQECSYMVAKTVAYERADVPVAAHWPASGALFVHEDGDHSDAVYYANTEFVRALMDSAGFAPIDTLFADVNGVGATQGEVQAVLNEGRGFVNYRGSAYAIWPAPFMFYPPLLTNGWNQPVVMSATCSTVGYDADHYLSHSLLRAGSVEDPKGAVALLGTTTSGFGLDFKRGYVDEGFFEHAFGVGSTLAEALEAGKLRLVVLAEDRQEYEGWTVIGDPELNLWTAPRATLSASHDESLQAGPTDFVVRVSAGGQPVQGAIVTCTLPPDIAVSAESSESGRAVLSFETSSAGTLSVVATARNAIPYRAEVEIIDQGAFIAPWSVEVDDLGGNGDGLVSPGESGSVRLLLVNSGDTETSGVTATLRSADAHVTVVDSIAAYGAVPAGGTAEPDRAYGIAVDPDRRLDEPIQLAAFLEYDDWTRLAYLPPIEVAAGRLVLAAATLDDRPPGGDGDGVADPGETAALMIELLNEGECGLTSVGTTLAATDGAFSVLSGEAPLADAPSGSLVANDATPFVVSIAPKAPTTEDETLSLIVSAAGHSYEYADTLDVRVTLEEAPASLALGPDSHGYYAFDSADTHYLQHPAYDWFDIAPPGPGQHIRYVSAGDDRMKLEIIPFSFVYYGQMETQISIGSNGVVAFGTSDYVFGDNSGIPDLHGPAAMLAPFWDDLNPAQGGDVYHWHDSAEHRYIIQYEDVLRNESDATETFQIVFLDPDHHPTPTGDGAILFQYESVSDTDGCTVGIENGYQDDGIEYAFDGAYHRHASELAGGLAVLFTTEPPSSPPAPWLVVRGVTLDDSAEGDGDGTAEPGETLTLTVELENAGTADAVALELALTTDDPAVLVVDGDAVVGDVPAGAVGSNAGDPFTLRVAADAADGRIPLWIGLAGNAGESQSALRYDLPIARPGDAVRTLAVTPGYPNPFWNGTSVRLDLPDDGRATHRVLVRVYNVAGRLVATAFDSRLPSGSHVVTWDGKGADGAPAASGVYFVRVDSVGATRVRKVVLLR
jgi:hypothetical protein